MSIFDSGLRFEYERVKPNLLAVLQFERDGGERILAPDGCRMDEDRLSVNAKRILAFERSRIGRVALTKFTFIATARPARG